MAPFDRIPMFFLVLGFGAGIIGSLSLGMGLRKAVAAGAIRPELRRNTMIGWFLLAVVPFTLLEVIRATTNVGTYEMAAWPASSRLAAASVHVVTWLVILGWTFLRGGDVFLATIVRSFNTLFAGVTAERMRVAMVFFAIVSLVGAALRLT